jgi:hypothetical protein
MNEKTLAELIASAIEEYQDQCGEENERVKMTWSFEQKGILTSDEGCVILLENGQEFHITVQEVGTRVDFQLQTWVAMMSEEEVLMMVYAYNSAEAEEVLKTMCEDAGRMDDYARWLANGKVLQ